MLALENALQLESAQLPQPMRIDLEPWPIQDMALRCYSGWMLSSYVLRGEQEFGLTTNPDRPTTSSKL